MGGLTAAFCSAGIPECPDFLAWGLSSLCALFPPGEAELLPAPFPLFPYTDTPCGLLPLILLLPFPLTLLLYTTNRKTIRTMVY